MRYSHTFLSLIILTFFSTLALAEESSIKSVMTVDGQKIGESVYEGQAIEWKITLKDASTNNQSFNQNGMGFSFSFSSSSDPIKQPEVEMNDNFELSSLGVKRHFSSSGFDPFSNKPVENGIIYTYQLVPLKTGELQLPRLVFEINGQRLTAGGGTLTVKSPEEQDFVRMKIFARRNGQDVSDSSVYPLQSFEVVLQINVKAIPGSNQNPLSVQDSSPVHLKIPWATDKLPDGLTTPSDVSVWLGPYQSASGGFSINKIVYGGMFNQYLGVFMPNPKKVMLPDANGKETKYWQYELVRRYSARKTGTYEFGPVFFQGVLAVDSQNGKLKGGSFYASAKALSVKVIEPPTQGRPDDYINAIGQFDMEASVTPDKVKVGDPITLTLRIRGSGSFEDMTAPKLESIPAFADNFKIYESSDKLTDGQMEFSWSMRPMNDKIDQIPAITASYFNLDAGQYVQMKTKPIPLTVEKGSALLMAPSKNPNAENGSSDQTWKTSQGGVHANVTDVNLLRVSSFDLMKSPSPFIWANGIVYGAFIALSVIVLLVRITKLNPAQARRRHAESVALAAIRQAKELADPDQQLDAVVKAITSYAADRQNVPSVGLTTDEVIDLLRQDGCKDENILAEARSILEMADAARFGGVNVDVNVPDKAEMIIKGLKQK